MRKCTLTYWLIFMAPFLFLLDGAGVEAEARDKAWAVESTALCSNPNWHYQLCQQGKRFHLHDPWFSHVWKGDKNAFHHVVVMIRSQAH